MSGQDKKNPAKDDFKKKLTQNQPQWGGMATPRL